MSAADSLDVRVRKRWGTVLGVYFVRVATAYVVATPFAAALGSSGVGRFDRGDARLFDPGGMLLLEVLARNLRELRFDAQATFTLLPALWLIGLLTHTALLVAFSTPGRVERAPCAARVATLIPGMLLLSVLGLLLEAVVVLTFGGVTLTLFDAASHQLTFLAPILLGLLFALLIGAFTDLARASLAQSRGDRLGSAVWEALSQATRSARSRPLALVLAYALCAVAALATLGIATLVVGRIPIENGSVWSALAVFAVHQCAIAAQVVFRAIWLARAVRVAVRGERTLSPA